MRQSNSLKPKLNADEGGKYATALSGPLFVFQIPEESFEEVLDQFAELTLGPKAQRPDAYVREAKSLLSGLTEAPERDPRVGYGSNPRVGVQGHRDSEVPEEEGSE